MQVTYELFLKNGGYEFITQYKYRTKEEAVDKAMRLNNELTLKGKTDRKYVVYKVTMEEVKF